MTKKLLLLVVCLVGWTAYAQQQELRGRVTSAEDGSGLPGVSVVVKGTQKGTQTDIEGNYKISAAKGATLVFSFVGMRSQSVAVGNQTVIDVKMAADDKQLGEVVVVGYGTQTKSKVSSSISKVNGDDISNLNTTSFDQQLAGRAAGVQVTVGTGIIGQAPRILIRGINSITSGTSPLMVVDGIPMIDGNQSAITPTNPLADINPDDIESFDILKDGAATAIYGSRAANGVILITTKKGRKNTELKTSLSVNYGFTSAINRLDLLNASQFVTIANEKLSNAGVASAANLDANATNTNWQDVILRQGISQNYSLAFSGGSKKTTYYFSLGYNDVQGASVASAQKRYSVSSNLEHELSKFLKIGTKLQVTRTENTGLNSGANSLSGNITNAARLFPNVPVYSATHSTGYNISTDGSVLGPGANTRNIDNNYTNIAFVLANNKNDATITRVFWNAFAEIKPIQDVTIRSQIGVDYLDTRSLRSWDPRHGDGRGSAGLVTQTSRNVTLWNWQNYATYTKSIDKHSLTATAGLEYQKTVISSFTAQGSNFSDLFFIKDNLVTGSFTTKDALGSYIPSGFDSYFGRINYDYANRYFLTLSIRNDGISSLPEANRRGTFMGISVGYRLSEEDFYKKLALSNTINSLKFRGSYAEVGNTNIGNINGLFPSLGLYGAAQYGSQNGIGFIQASNPNLKWETSKKNNIGLDFGILANKITGSIDYFYNDISGLILDAPTAPSLGIPNNTVSQNIGSMENKGWEFLVNAEVLKKKDFTWNVSVNYTDISNKVTSLVKNSEGIDQDIFPGSTIFPGSYFIIRAGNSITGIYGYESAGVNSANGFPMFVKGDGKIVQRNVATGAYSFYDAANPTVTTNTTGAALSSTTDRKVLGYGNPTWYGGFTNNFTYKNFDFEIFCRFSGGNKILNITRQETLLNQDFNNNGTEILTRWQKPGDVTDVPKLYIGNGNIINLNSNAISRFVEKGDFFRIQNISLGYTLPKTVSTKVGISKARLFFQVQNVLTISGYKGLDPELNSGANTENGILGIDFNSNPQFRVVTFGANINF